MSQSKIIHQHLYLIILFVTVGMLSLSQTVSEQLYPQFTVESSEICFSFSNPDIVTSSEIAASETRKPCSLHDLVIPPTKTVFFFSRIPINTADKQLLAAVRGVGQVTAERIVSWRQANGNIANRSDLEKIPGIGPRKAQYLASQFTFDTEIDDEY